LRTSSIILPSTPGVVSNMRFLNYSDSSCVSYKFEDNSLQISSAYIDPATYPTLDSRKVRCGALSLASYTKIIPSNVSNVFFDIVPSSQGTPNVMGKVTVSIEVCASANCSGSLQDRARIQSSVSLRDYNTVGH